jgi:uncharacterized phage-associated protein
VRFANDIASWFVRYSADELGAPVDPMSLEKLIYYAQAFHLVLEGEPLFPDEIQAWKWGPVIPGVYKQYASYGADPIILPLDGDAAALGKGTEKFLTEIVEFFCRHTAANLSRATHSEQPWIDAIGSSDNAVSQSSLRQFYGSLIEDGECALSRLELLDSIPEPRWSSLYVAGICWRRMTRHPFYDGALARQLSSPSRVEDKLVLPEDFYAPVKGKDFIEFTADEDPDDTIRRAIS